MGKITMRVTEGQRALILWLEEEANYDYIMDVLNNKYHGLMEHRVGYYKYQNSLSEQARFFQHSEVNTQYLDKEVQQMKETLDVFKDAKANRQNARGRSKPTKIVRK